jgi:AAA15 family ATPase/GTPase
MLIMFKVKNYTSFKEEAILDMRATSYVQHPSHVINVDDNLSLVKTSALYGANASGKSNFIAAMFFFERYLMAQFINKKETPDFNDLASQRNIKIEPFMLSAEENEASEFEIIFLHNGKQIQYGYECTTDEVLNEWFYIDDKKVFERNPAGLTFGKKYQHYLNPYQKVPAERLYLAVLDYFLDESAKTAVLGDFLSFFENEYHVYSEILFEPTVKKLAGLIRINKRLLNDCDYRKKIERYLKSIDVGISRLDVQTEVVINRNTNEEKEEEIIRTVHEVYNQNGEVVGEKYFDLKQESTGTLRFLAYIQNITELIETGGVFIVDEMSARLHPLLTKLIVDLFQSSSNKKAQLIFTTHDISILNNAQFRRDEIVFVDKNPRGESTLYALSDLKVREDATFNKDYLQGKYGAIPIFDVDTLIKGDLDG